MAQFNPGLNPTSDPNYLGYSRPISQPDAAKTYATLFQGIGNVLEAGAKAGDFLVKETIDSEVYKQVDRERDAYTQALDTVKTSLDKGKSGALDILTGNTGTAVPQDLEDGLSEVERLAGARGAGLNDTYYKGRLAAIAKSLRTQFPGYREYIDQKIAQTTGGNPANEYITNILQDINRSLTRGNSEKDKQLNFIKQNAEVPGAEILFDKVSKGEIDFNTAFKQIAKYKQYREMLNVSKAEREDWQGNRTVLKEKTSSDADIALSNEVNNYLDTLTVGTGANKINVADLVRKGQTGQLQLDDARYRQLGEQVTAARQVLQTQLWKAMNEKDAKGQTMVSILGPQAAKEKLEQHLLPIDTIAQAIKDKDWGMAFSMKNMNAAIQASTTNGLLRNETFGGHLRMLQSMRDIAGEQYTAGFVQAGLQRNLDQNMKAYVDNVTAKLITQPDIRTTGNPFTLKQAVEDAQSKNVKLSTVYDAFITQVQQIGDAKTPDAVKINLIKAAYDPANLGLISKFNQNGWDPQTGRPIPGQTTVYLRMTSPEITKEIKRLDQTNPGLFNMYRNWAETSFGSELFNRDINDLNRIQENSKLRINYVTPDSNSGTPYLQVTKIGGPGAAGNAFERAAERTGGGVNADLIQAQRVVNRINMGLTGLSNVAKAEGSDPSVYLMRQLQGMGYKPKVSGPVTGTPNNDGSPALATSDTLRQGWIDLGQSVMDAVATGLNNTVRNKFKRGEGTNITSERSRSFEAGE